MKAIFCATSKLSIEVEGESQRDLFEELAHAQETFSHEKCGCCNKDNFRFMCRQNEDQDKFFELMCLEYGCKAKLAFGCHKKGGGLFPKRRWDALSPGERTNRAYQEKDCKSGFLPNNGWFKFIPNKKQEET